MAKKKAHWKAEEEAGLLDSTQWPRLNYTKCVNGIAQAIEGSDTHKFRCKNVSHPARNIIVFLLEPVF